MAAIKRKSTTTKAEKKKHKPGIGQSNPSCMSCNSSLHKHSNHPTRQITGTLHTNENIVPQCDTKYCESTFSVIYKMYHKTIKVKCVMTMSWQLS